MATNLNESKIVEVINQLKNTDVPNKSDLIGLLQSLVAKMGIAKSESDVLLKAATDDSSKLISRAITFFIGAGKDEPMAGSIAARLKQILISENIKALKAGNGKNRNETIKRLQAQYDDAEASIARSEPATITNPEFEALRDSIRDGDGSVYRKFTQRQFVNALEKRAGSKSAPEYNEYEVAKSLIESSGGSAEFRAKQLEILKQRYSDELEKAQHESLPEPVKKNLETIEGATEELVRHSATPEEFGEKIAALLGLKKVQE
jgi:hypothetical protein